MTATATSAPVLHETREAWLLAAVEALRPIFEEVGETIPPVRVSVGFPGGRGKKNSVIGQCWASVVATDKVSQIFIHPKLADPVRILDVLAHEIIHAVDDCKSGHRGRFAKIAKGIGLVAPMTATTAGEDLKVRLTEISEALGAFPHAALGDVLSASPKQTTRMKKVECPSCGYTLRTTEKWLSVGLPTCVCGTAMEAV